MRMWFGNDSKVQLLEVGAHPEEIATGWTVGLRGGWVVGDSLNDWACTVVKAALAMTA